MIEKIKSSSQFTYEYLGRGCFSTVKSVINSEGTPVYALKVIKKSQSINSYVQREIQIQKSFDSPYIVKLIEVNQSQSQFQLLLQYCGIDLGTIISRSEEGYFSLRRSCLLLNSILQGITLLHRRGIVHRDLKPQNLLMSLDQTHIKICDLGFAKQNVDLCTVLGTSNYIAPEIMERKQQYGFGVDVWSLGVIFYQFLYGEYPFSENIQQIKRKCKQGFRIPFRKPLGASEQDIVELKRLFAGIFELNVQKRLNVNQIKSSYLFRIFNFTNFSSLLKRRSQNFVTSLHISNVKSEPEIQSKKLSSHLQAETSIMQGLNFLYRAELAITLLNDIKEVQFAEKEQTMCILTHVIDKCKQYVDSDLEIQDQRFKRLKEIVKPYFSSTQPEHSFDFSFLDSMVYDNQIMKKIYFKLVFLRNWFFMTDLDEEISKLRNKKDSLQPIQALEDYFRANPGFISDLHLIN